MQFSLKNEKEQRIGQLLVDWFLANRRVLPWAEPASSCPRIVSEFMLQQFATVIPYWNHWIGQFPSISARTKASEE
jgi:A/G-specific adenine glycosylase